MDNSQPATINTSSRDVDNQGGEVAKEEVDNKEGLRNTEVLDNKETTSQLKEKDNLKLGEVDNRIRS